MRKFMLLSAAILLMSACSPEETAAIPEPLEMTEEAVGHYCQMYVLEHDGPKAQIFLAGQAAPLWFSQVRDAVAFVQSPEKIGEIVVIYVSDMGRAESWESPGADNFIPADSAIFVVGAAIEGGMGVPEFIPFGTEAAAEAFAAAHGGRLASFEELVVEDEVPANAEGRV